MERSGRDSRRAGMVLTGTPPAGSEGTRYVKMGGPGFRSVAAEMTEGREINPIGRSRTRLSFPPPMDVPALQALW